MHAPSRQADACFNVLNAETELDAADVTTALTFATCNAYERALKKE